MITNRSGLRWEPFLFHIAVLILIVAVFSERPAAQVSVTISPALVTLATLATQYCVSHDHVLERQSPPQVRRSEANR